MSTISTNLRLVILSETKDTNNAYDALVNNIFVTLPTFGINQVDYIIGAGQFPAGLVSTYGVQPIVFDKVNKILPDIDGKSQGTGPYINPNTKNYEFDNDQNIKGCQTNQQLIYIALNTLKDSSSIPGFGMPYYQKETSPGLEAKLKQDIKTALKHIKSIKIKNIDVQRIATKFQAIISYINIDNNSEEKVTI